MGLPSLPNRTTLRNSLVTNLKAISWVVAGPVTVTPLADIAGSARVFGFWKKDPGGISPFACVDSGNIQYSTSGSTGLLTPMTMVIGFWARRESTDSHDVLLDNLILAFTEQVLRVKYNARFSSPSVSDFEILDGIPYKFELHFVEFEM